MGSRVRHLRGVGGTLTLGRCKRCLPTSKNALPYFCWKHLHVLFLLVWCVSLLVVRLGAYRLCFCFFSLSSPKNHSLTLLVVGISTLVLILLIFNFWSWLFCIIFIYFQFHHSIPIYKILYSPMRSLFFGFFIFFLGFIVRVLVIFNFIIQFKLMVLFFSIWSSFFSISPFNYNIILFLCQFWSLLFLFFCHFTKLIFFSILPFN